MAQGGWPVTTDKVTIRPGDTSSDIATIRQHLIIEGDIQGGSGRNPTFDQEFLEGLARFQIRNGLRVSGFVDSRTLAALNVSAPERLRQLETNLARIQGLMSINKAPRYVLVNVPAFVAQGVRNGELSFESNVIAGKPARATPQVSAKIVEVNFFPTWSVPEIVAQQDLIPKIRKDPSYFSEEHFSVMTDWKAPPLDPATVDWNSPQVVSYKFRQEPGTFNALGVVRINMPNKYSVYMHDTPLKQLFSQSARAFSSGCVRVEKVLELVAWLLGDQNGWTLEKVQAQVDSGKKHRREARATGAGAFRLSHGLRQRRRRRPVQARHLWPRCRPRRSRRPSQTRSSPSRAAPSPPKRWVFLVHPCRIGADGAPFAIPSDAPPQRHRGTRHWQITRHTQELT